MKPRWEPFQAIAGASFDVCIIGGGATGAGCAWGTQLRGLKTALIEAATLHPQPRALRPGDKQS